MSSAASTLRVTPTVSVIKREKVDVASDTFIDVQDLQVFYGFHQAIKGVSLAIPSGIVTALIGPSGCGKSTFLRCLNRLNDSIDGVRILGSVCVAGRDIYSPSVDVVDLRKRIGMVFQRSNPFPKSVFDNVAFGPRTHGVRGKSELAEVVETSLKRADLWEEVKDRLKKPALDLSGGQQQRLCIARALAVDPQVLLMDEPASALDPRSTARIENLIADLRGRYTIVIVTHNMQQAARVSDRTAFFLEGKLVECGPTEEIFTNPTSKETEDYVSGRYG